MSPAPLSKALRTMVRSAAYKPKYDTREHACFAVLCAMARNRWTWPEVVEFVFSPYYGMPAPLWQGYFWGFGQGSPQREWDRSMDFLRREWGRAIHQVGRVRIQSQIIRWLAELEFPDTSKSALSRLAGYRAHLLSAERYGIEYGLGREDMTELSGLSVQTTVEVQAWLEEAGLVRCLSRGNYYKGRVSRFSLVVPQFTEGEVNQINEMCNPDPLLGSEIDSSSLSVAIRLDNSSIRERLNCLFHALGLGPAALPWAHPPVRLQPIHPVWRSVGRLPWFLWERLDTEMPTVLPRSLARVAREQLQPQGLAKFDLLRAGWIRIEQDLEMLQSGLRHLDKLRSRGIR